MKTFLNRHPALFLALLLSLPASSQAAELELMLFVRDREYLSTSRDLHLAQAINPPIEPEDEKSAEALSEASPDLYTPHPTPHTATPKPQPSSLADLPADRSATDLVSPAITPSSTPSSAIVASETKATDPDLRIRPRAGVGYNGAGYEGSDAFGRLEGFVPLRQNPGGDITFLEGRLLLDNGANLGSNAIIGHRAYSKKDNRIYGGYIGYDTRNTSEKFFQQLGFGFESLGEVWDIRTNFYIPIGDIRQQVNLADTNAPLTVNRFQGHFLLVDFTRIRQSEAALFSFDLEGGGRIAKLGTQGEVRLYGGPYYYSGPGSPATVGWRMRADIRPNDHLNFGVGFQTDGLFGTNLLFRVGASFPSSRPKGPIPPDQSVLARLGEFVERNPSIVVDSQSETFLEERPALNPATGDPWFFNHVTLGVSGGDGTFENPFGLVQNGLNNTRSDGNDIVYVAQGSNPTIPPFTIPDKVQVLSRGPVQTIPITTRLESGGLIPSQTIQIPLSNTGNFPRIVGAESGGAVIMGNDSVLSGFTITPTSGSVGVLAQNVQNVDIRENRITTTGDDAAGVRLQNVSGFAFITNNQIQTSGNTTNNAFNNTNFLTSGAHGIEIDLLNTTLDTSLISGNTISTAGTYAAGILNNVRDGGTLTQSTISGNTVSTVGDDSQGISSRLRNNGGGSARIDSLSLSGNIVSTQGAYADALDVEVYNASSVGSVTISGNTASAQGDEAEAIDIELEDSSADSIAIANNTASTQGRRAEGIHVEIDDDGGGASLGTLLITGNIASTQGNGAYGIDVEIDNDGGGASLGNTTISGNQVSTQGNGADGIYLGLDTTGSGSANIGSATISGNTVSTQGNRAFGIFTGVYTGGGGSASINAATISGNTVSTQGNRAYGILTSVYTGGGGSSSIGITTISGNTVSTQGNRAYGIYTDVFTGGAGSSIIGSATVSGNTVSTQGVNALGIYTFVSTDSGGSASINAATISGNTVSTQGNGGYGIVSYALRAGGGTPSVCATLSGNTATTNQAGVNPFVFVNFGGTFQILDTAATFPTTQAMNTAIANGGAIPFGFFPAVGAFTQVTSCP